MSLPPLSIAILNLMPTKETTARHLTELLTQDDNQPVEVTLLYPASHYQDKPVPADLLASYRTFADVAEQPFDGYIITGAPLEQLDFEAIDYWQELCQILDYLQATATPLLAICWGAQAALYYYYQIQKVALAAKTVGVFQHQVQVPTHPLTTGLGSQFLAPHSRYTTVDEGQVHANGLLDLASSPEAGLYLLGDATQRETYVFGHAEYDRLTLAGEYSRDCASQAVAPFPQNYFPEDNPAKEPLHSWAGHGQQLFKNWLTTLQA